MIKAVLCPIYECAEQFYKSAELLLQQTSTDILTYGTPAIVNMAFAIELYLKTIYVLEAMKESVREHKYNDLFNRLSNESQHQIREQFTKRYAGDESFDVLLNYYSNVFQEWRYIYENHSINHVRYSDLKLLADVAKQKSEEIIKEVYSSRN